MTTAVELGNYMITGSGRMMNFKILTNLRKNIYCYTIQDDLSDTIAEIVDSDVRVM